MGSFYVCKHCGRSIPCAPGEEWKYCCPECFARNEAARKQQLETENNELKIKNYELLMRLADVEAAKAQALIDLNKLLKKQL